MKKTILFTALLCLFICIPAAAESFDILENFEQYPEGRWIQSPWWTLTERAQNGGNLSIVKEDEGNVLKNMITYDQPYTTRNSYIQSHKFTLEGTCVISIRMRVPPNMKGNFSVGLRGVGQDADANTMGLCTLNSTEITYLPIKGTEAVKENMDGQWVHIRIVLEEDSHRLRIYRDGELKDRVENFREINNGQYRAFNTDSFHLRLLSSVGKNIGDVFTVYYDDVHFYNSISSEDDLCVSSPVLQYTDEGGTRQVKDIREGVLHAIFALDYLGDLPLDGTFISGRYENRLLKDVHMQTFTLDRHRQTYKLLLPTDSVNIQDEVRIFFLDSSSLKPLSQRVVYEKSPYTRPTATDVSKLYQMSESKGVHPRILATDVDFCRLRAGLLTDDFIKSTAQTVIAYADSMLNLPTCEYVLTDGKRLLTQSRLVLTRMITLGLAYQLTTNTKYSDRAWLELESAGNFPDWNPAHFLDTAEMTAAFAIGYDWMYDAFADEYTYDSNGKTIAKHKFLEKAIYHFGLSKALTTYRGTQVNSWDGFKISTHNWNSVCNGGMTLGALALLDVYPEDAYEVIAYGLESLEAMMPSFAPDGAWFEGPGYWHYAVKYLTFMLAGLDSTLGGDFGASQFPALAESIEFISQVTGPCGTNNFHDSTQSFINAPEVFWYAEKYNSPQMSESRFYWIDRTDIKTSSLDLIYYKEQSVRPRIIFPLNRYYRGVEMFSMRSSWEDPNAAFVSAHAGASVVNHSHLDSGSFVFDSNGVRWAVDLGSDNLTYTTHYGDLRYDVYRIRPEAHNTLVIKPDHTPGHDLDAWTFVEHFQDAAGDSFAIMDLSDAFKGYASCVKRGIRMQDEASGILIRDEINLKQAAPVYWFMQTQAQVHLEGGNRATLVQGTKVMHLAFESNAQSVTISKGPSEPLITSPNPANQQSNDGVTRIIIELQAEDEVFLSVKLSPNLADAQSIPSETLSSWQ